MPARWDVSSGVEGSTQSMPRDPVWAELASFVTVVPVLATCLHPAGGMAPSSKSATSSNAVWSGTAIGELAET